LGAIIRKTVRVGHAHALYYRGSKRTRRGQRERVYIMLTQMERSRRSPVGTLFHFGSLGSLSDAELLKHFRTDPDSAGQEAFRILVERHGPMVQSVCRNLIKDPHETDDAFQATFLVLVQKADSISVHDTVGPWLYGVACRVARRARTRSSQRRKREIQTAFDIPSPNESVAAHDGAVDVVHEEIARLPASLRAPIVLCCLQGINYDWAARRLGVSEPTLRGRLHRARKRLALRLGERGIARTPAAIAIELIGVKLPNLPPALTEATLQQSMRWASLCGLVGGEAGVPESIADLARGVLKTMFLQTCKLSAVAALLVAGVVGSVAWAQQGTVQESRKGSMAPRANQGRSAASTRSGGPAASGTPRQQYEDLISQYQKEEGRYSDDFRKLKTAQERNAYAHANFPVARKVAGRFLELARSHPRDAVAFDALAWVAIWGFGSPESEDAAAILARDYAWDQRLWLVCEDIRRGPISLPRASLLRAVLAHNPDRSTRGRACFDLAQLLTEQSEFSRLLKTPGLKPWHAQFYPEERLARFRALDVKALNTEAQLLFQRVIDEFPDVVPLKWWTVAPQMVNLDPATLYQTPRQAEPESGTLGDRARPALAEIRDLSVGEVAPDIEGVDIDGHRFKLSDYRGKVVVLDFSGSWCGSCRQMYPHFREFVQRYKDRPFALLSVMADEKREAIHKEIAAGEITWRCWWEKGGTDGSIPRAWNVRGYPTVYILDHEGVIRLKFTGLFSEPDHTRQPPIDDFLRLLLDECEASGQR
jgi:RNA polymerase sigma factor (sigma-70 family)